MKLFDDIPRDFMGIIPRTEHPFISLNRSARPIAEKIRKLLEEWFSHYPAAHQENLRIRFCNKNDEKQHHSAFFELYLYELLLRLNCQHVEIEPSLSHTAKRPDFLAETPSGRKFYLEAVTSAGEDDSKMNLVLDAIDQIPSPNFRIDIRINNPPSKHPNLKKIKSFVSMNLSKLDPDEVTEQSEVQGYKNTLIWIYEDEDMMLELRPSLRPLARRDANRRTSGIIIKASFPNTYEAIRRRINEKAGKYGELDSPYIVAINSMDTSIDQIDIMEALFGQEQFTLSWDENDEPNETQISRILNGVWTRQSKPTYTRLSAVLMVENLTPWNIHRANIRLYHNPWAAKPFLGELADLPQAIPENNLMKLIEGKSVMEIFGLPEDWFEE